MTNILDIDCPRRIEIIRLLKQANGLFISKSYKNIFSIYEYLGNNGRTREIVKQLIETQIIVKKGTEYYYNHSLTKKLLKDTIYARCAKEHGLGEIFG